MRASSYLLVAALMAFVGSAFGEEEGWQLDVSPGSVQLGEFAWSTPRLGLLCEGEPREFAIRLRVGTSRSIGREIEGHAHGVLRHASFGERTVLWESDRSWASATFDRSVLAALASAGELVVQVELPGGEIVERALPHGIPSEDVDRFLGACDLPFAWKQSTLEYEGAQVELGVAVTEDDLAAVLALARESGLPDAAHVSIGGGLNETTASVESSWIVRPGVRSRASISVFHEYWSHKRPHRSSRDLWYVSGTVDWDERHVIRDGEWEVEIRLEPDVTPATAFRILTAFHRGEWVDALHPQLVAFGVPMPGPDYLDDAAGPLRLVRAETREGLPEDDVFELEVPSSRGRWSVSRLHVTDLTVELLYIGMAVD